MAVLVAVFLLLRRSRNRLREKETIDITVSNNILQPQSPGVLNISSHQSHQLAPLLTQPYPRPQTYSDVSSVPNPWGGVGTSSQNLVFKGDSRHQQDTPRSDPVSNATYLNSSNVDTTEQLRSEVENLRREMQNIQAQRSVMYLNEVDETPPPEYIPSEVPVASSSSLTRPLTSIQPRSRKL